jgi:hypothetical protein
MSEKRPEQGDSETRKEPTPSQQRLIDLVKLLATSEAHDSPDIIKSGKIQLWPGVELVALILDINLNYMPPILNPDAPLMPPGQTVPDLYQSDPGLNIIYALEARDEPTGRVLESVDVDQESFKTHLDFDDAEPYMDNPDGAPDYAIDSFFDRYWLHNIEQQQELQAS